MDIEHPAFPFPHERVAQYPHITRECDVTDICIDDAVVHHCVVHGAIEMQVGLGKSCDALRGGDFQAFCVGVVASDKDDFVRRVGVFGGVKERCHVGAGAGYEDGDAGFSHQKYRSS